jgi:hypothetical protein
VTVRDGVTDSASLFNGTAEQGEADEICVVLGYYAAYVGSSLPTFRDNLSVLTLKDGTESLF